MKVIDMIAIILLLVGGLNLGLVGFFNFDLIGMIFGQIARVIYALVGLSAIYYIIMWKSICKHWKKR